ncbi:MAG: COX15/CtaA family protein [Gemmatimonadota bacterium]|nr:MAG: COX15/CtaA family protein [Gemmatimonadota bacterium]
MKTLRTLAWITAAFAYAIIVLGFVVRITGSGMGCGDDWPLCNGRVLPAFDSAKTVIEFAHRLAVLGLTALTLALAAHAYKLRGAPGGSGPGGTLRPAALAVLLLVVQSLLGAVTVKLELPPHTVVLHLGAGLTLLATLVVLGLRAGVHGGMMEPPPGIAIGRGGIIGATVLAGAVILLGGMVATTGAAPACQGFPLCNGQFWPTATASGLPHIHWTHRLLAYALFFHLIGLGLGLRRKQVAARIQEAGWVVVGLGVAQVVVGAVMVLSLLMPVWRGVHAALGTALWVALVYLVWLAPKAPTGTAGTPN